MKHQLQAIIFDFDYTLADPSRGIETCLNFALNGLGLPAVSPEQIFQSVGLSLADTFRQLAGPAHEARYDEFFQLFVERADGVMVDLTVLFEAVPFTLEQLRAQGVSLGIVSLKYREHIEPVLAREKLLDSFEVIIGGRDVARPKPNPEGVSLAMDQLGSSLADSIFVGDSLIDAETAKRAGLPFVAVLSGVTTREAFHGYEVERIVENLAELLQWIGGHR